MPLNSGFSISIRDGKGKVRNLFLRANIIDDTTTTVELDALTLGVANRIQALTTGEIVSAAYVRARSTAAFAGDADPDSDVEEGAIFLGRSGDGYTTSIRLPTFDEDKLIAGSRLVDMTDTDVADFVGLLQNEVVGFSTDVDFIVYAGDSIGEIYKAYEQFKASKGVPS